METTEYLFAGKYPGIKFKFEGRDAELVIPDNILEGKPWTLKTEYNNAFPAVECALLEKGVARAFVATESRWGHPDDIHIKARFVKFLHDEFGLSDKCIPVGYSCGGLYAVKFAGYHPECVQLMYIDAPVINLLSCPLCFGHPDMEPRVSIQPMLDGLKMKSVIDMLTYRDHPYDHLAGIVRNGIPCCMVYGDDDKVVLWEENAKLVNEAYEGSGVPYMSVCVPGRDHHPHEPNDMDEVVEFILKNI